MIPKIKFVYDKEKDLFNLWDTCNKEIRFADFSSRMPSKVLEIAKGKDFKKCKKEIENYYKSVHKSKIMKIYLDSLNKSWKSIEKEYFKRLEKITKKPFPFKKVTAYVTIAPKCPYSINEKWFMVGYLSGLANDLRTAAHELMHFQFMIDDFERIKKEVGEEKAHDLRESLTVLLNLEFKDLWFVKDRGYDMHQDLRKFITKQWEEKKDFELLLTKCVKYLREK